jgi:hypothetical protein
MGNKKQKASKPSTLGQSKSTALQHSPYQNALTFIDEEMYLLLMFLWNTVKDLTG